MGYYNDAYGNVGNAPTTAVAAGAALKHVADHADQTKLQANNAAMNQIPNLNKYNEDAKAYMSSEPDKVLSRARQVNEEYNKAYFEHSRIDSMEDEITSEHSHEQWEKAMSITGKDLDAIRGQKEYFDNYMHDLRNQAAQLDLRAELLAKNNKIINGQLKTKSKLGTFHGPTFISQLVNKGGKK